MVRISMGIGRGSRKRAQEEPLHTSGKAWDAWRRRQVVLCARCISIGRRRWSWRGRWDDFLVLAGHFEGLHAEFFFPSDHFLRYVWIVFIYFVFYLIFCWSFTPTLVSALLKRWISMLCILKFYKLHVYYIVPFDVFLLYFIKKEYVYFFLIFVSMSFVWDSLLFFSIYDRHLPSLHKLWENIASFSSSLFSALYG